MVAGEEGGGERGGGEGEEVEGDEEEFVEGADGEEDVLCIFPISISHILCIGGHESTYLVVVVQVEQPPRPRLVNLLVALPGPAHTQCRVHVHVVACQIKAYQPLEENRPSREGGGKEDEQAGCCAPIGDHVEDCAELCGLLEVARGYAVKGVEKAGNAVEEGACPGVEGHVVERCDGEDDAGVACSTT